METIKAKFKRKTCYAYDLTHFILEFLEDRLYHIGIADYIVWIEYPTADCIPEWLANMDAVKSVLNGNGPSEVDIEVPADPFLQNPNVVLDPTPELIAIAEVNCFGSPLTVPISWADNLDI